MAKAKAARASTVESEAQLRRRCIRLAKSEGWYHVRLHFGPGAAAGVPDDLFIRDGRFLFIEFKRVGGRVSPIQQHVIEALRAHGATVYVCRSFESFALMTLDPVTVTP